MASVCQRPGDRRLSERKYAYPLILNKVASPRYATPTLRRARLIDWLNEAAAGRATVIAADAGYGKTTLLWQWEREVDFPCYWYKLDRNDRDWTLHISYLAESIAKRHPGFGRRTHSMLEQMGGPGSSRPGVTAYLLAEMHKRLTEPCTFIIDDWHYVNAVTEVRGLWNQILRDAPSTCRFVFASRVKPTLQFARFKTHGGYAQLRTDALRFTEPEIDDLFRDIYNDPLEPGQVAELERRTEGWAASLQLVEVTLRERLGPQERQEFIQSITATKDSDLFDFLAEEVLDQQPEDTRNFLLATSILQQITPEVAERLTGSHDGQRELIALEQRGLFTNRLDEVRYRYHNLFREFLERRLVTERSEAEVIGLHIHAASYFETTEQWPEAIHHYLRAGLHRQAARLIAKFGEDVVSEGRLGLVDEWLQQLPEETIKQNARLSLLFGEASGIRGDWDRAINALERARGYFSRKGDRRLEALACLKLSTVFSNLGDPDSASSIAETGLAMAPPDAAATRLRLAGNLAITRTWMTEDLGAVARECQRIGGEATALGLEHFAAIAHHNAGAMLSRMGRLKDARAELRQAAMFWADPPLSPFADNHELVEVLVALGELEEAKSVASEAVRRTVPWPRPHGDALTGLAVALMADGQFDAAASALIEARSHATFLGGIRPIANSLMIEALFLGGRSHEIPLYAADLTQHPPDPRHAPDSVAGAAIALHTRGDCDGDCQRFRADLDRAEQQGAAFAALVGRVKLGALAVEHRNRRYHGWAWRVADEAVREGLAPSMRWWLRRLAGTAAHHGASARTAHVVAALASTDPDGWRDALVQSITRAGDSRPILLKTLSHVANRDTLNRLEGIGGEDVAALRRHLRFIQSPRLFIRTLGGLELHRSGWAGPVVPMEKKRVRMLLAVLAAHHRNHLSRDTAIDILWPEADPLSAVNSLNQTVYQLRRFIDPAYRAGESTEYVISSAEQVALNPSLAVTDLDEIRRLPERLAAAPWNTRETMVRRAVELVRGEFLADLRYEDWASRQQLGVHSDVRDTLLPIAARADPSIGPSVAIHAAMALLRLDPFDEPATLALADALTSSGRAAAARRVVLDYVQRLQDDLELAPSHEFAVAAVKHGQARIDRSAKRLS
jgi:ATP/maltotriose-dependent transcriptional regulator MalT/DNA-binding SARP family transcriptional activator